LKSSASTLRLVDSWREIVQFEHPAEDFLTRLNERPSVLISFIQRTDATTMEDHFGLLWIHVGFAAIVGVIMLLFWV
jgi:hypothetical protein